MSELVKIGFKADSSDLKNANKDLNKLTSSGKKQDKSNQSLTSSFKKLAGAVGLAAAAVASLSKLTTITREFDVLNAQLITATGSSANAAKAFAAIQKFAAETPYDLQQVTKGFTQLVNLGLTPSEAALTSYGNTASAMGKDLSQLIEAVADAATGEFERLKEFGIKSKSEGDNVSFTFRGVTKTVKKNAEEIEQYLQDLGNNEFAGAMAQRMDTLDGKMSNLGDSWDKLFLTISQQGVGSIIQDSVEIAIAAVETFTDFIESEQFAASVNVMGLRFKGWADDVENAVSYVTGLFSEMPSHWLSSVSAFIDEAGHYILNMPEYFRYAVQRSAVELASLIDYGAAYGEAFGQVLGVKLGQFVESAKVYGQAIAAAINPWADDFDLESKLVSLDSLANDMADESFKKAEARAEVIKQIRLSSIKQIEAERDANIAAVEDGVAAIDKLGKAYDESKKKSEEAAKQQGDQLKQFKVVVDKTSESTVVIDKDLDKLINKADDFGGAWSSAGNAIIDAFGSAANVLDDYSKKMSGISSLQSELTSKRKEYADGTEQATKIDNELFKLSQAAYQSNIGAVGKLAGVTSSAFKEQSKARRALHAIETSFAAVEIALAAEKAVMNATASVANQGSSGDPYTAFGRVAAMAGIMAGVLGAAGIAFGAGGGGFKDESKAAQEAQGLNVWGDKSESIGNSIEMTASATEKLVGINTNMLKALQSLQAGISAAAGMVFRDTKSAAYSYQPDVNENIFSGGVGGAIKDVIGFGGLADKLSFGLFSGIFDGIGKLLGGSSKVVDSGIRIIGGAFEDLLDGVEVYAFQTVKSKKYAWSKKKTNTELVELDAASTQFDLVFQSLADSVYEGGIALGMSGSSLEDAINNFVLETVNISLKDLSVADQQAEIEAVFSKIFDDLAGSVIPFIGEFQKTGESLGETLSRVATQVSIADFSVKNLGVTLGDKLANPKIYAQIADNLATLTGGIESFAEKIASFVDNFAPEAVKFTIASDALTESLTDVGLKVPASSEGFWKLMDSLDGTTAAGQEQIAMLLNVQETAKDYYDMLEKRESDRAALVSNFESSFGGEKEVSIPDLEKELLDGLKLARFTEIPETADELYELFENAYGWQQDKILAIQDVAREYYDAVEAAQQKLAEEAEQIEADRLAALEELQTAASTAFSELSKAVDLEKQLAQARLDSAREAYNAETDRINGLRDALESTYSSLISNAQNAENELNKSFNAEKEAVQAALNEQMKLRDAELERISAIRSGIESTYSQLVNNLSTAEEALNKSFNAEKEAVQAALNEQVKLRDAELERISATRNAIESTYSQLVNNLSIAEDALNKSFNAEMSAINATAEAKKQAIDDEISGIREAANNRVSSLQNEASIVSQRASDLRSLADSLSSATGVGFSVAEALTAARSGNFSKAMNMNTEQIDSSSFSSAEELKAAQELQSNRLLEIGRLAEGQATIEERMLASIESQINSTNSAADRQIAELEAQKQLIDDSAKAQIEALQEQLNALLGIDDSTLSLADAIKAFQDAQKEVDNFGYESQLEALSKLEDIANANYEKSEEEAAKQIEQLDEQLNALLGIDTTILSLADAIKEYQEAQKAIDDFGYESQLEALASLEDVANESYEKSAEEAAKQLQNLDDQLNALLGIDTTILSLSDAIKEYQEAQKAIDELGYEDQLAMLDLLQQSADDVYKLHEEAYNDEIARLDMILADGEAQLNALLDIDTSVMSVSDALDSLESSIKEANDFKRDNESLRKELELMREEAANANKAIAKSSATTAAILQRLEIDGIDTRVVQ